MSVNKKLAELKKAFVGISEFRFRSVSEEFVSDMIWDFELPILRDTFTFNTAEATFEERFIHGSSIPYTSVGTPGETTLGFEVPSIDEDILGWLMTKAKAVLAIKDTVGGVEGTWTGAGYKIDGKALNGMIMIISEDKTKAIVIKNFKGYSSPNMDELSNTPVSFVISATLESSQSTDEQGDILFLDFTKTAGASS